MLAAITRSRQGFANASQDSQVLKKQSPKAFGALRHTVWLLLRTPGQSSSQNRDQSEEHASGNRPRGTALAPQGQITSGQGSANARLAGRWQGLPGWHLPMVWPAGGKGWAQGADTKAMHRLTPRVPAAGLVPQPGCHGWSLQPASKISLHKHPPPQAPACARKAFHRGPGEQAGPSK